MLVIRKGEPNQIFKANDLTEIEKILKYVREKRLFHKKYFNKEFKGNNQEKMRPWVTNLTSLRISDVNELLGMTAKMQYKFPNCTSELEQKRKNNDLLKNMKKLSLSEDISQKNNKINEDIKNEKISNQFFIPLT